MRPILAFLGGVAGFIGGAVVGMYAGRAIGSEGAGYLISGVLMFVLAIAGYSWSGSYCPRGKTTTSKPAR